MKIIGESSTQRYTKSYIVEMTKTELLQLVEFSNSFTNEENFEPKSGDEFSISKLWYKFRILNYNRKKLREAYEELVNQSKGMIQELDRADFYTVAVEDD